MNSAITHICVHVCMGKYVFIFLESISRSGIAGSCGKFVFNILETAKQFSTISAQIYVSISSG